MRSLRSAPSLQEDRRWRSEQVDSRQTTTDDTAFVPSAHGAANKAKDDDANCNDRGEREQEPTYLEVVNELERDLDRVHDEKLQSRAEMTKKLYRVAVAEKELVAIEARERKEKRAREREREQEMGRAWEETGKA